MKISTIVLSDKTGGCDVLMEALKRQSFPRTDYEVLFVDDSWEKRKDVVTDYFRENGIENFRHLPIEQYFNYARNYSAAFNTGIRHAETEDLIVSLGDFIYIPSGFLEIAWKLYEKDPKGCYSGYKWWCQAPLLGDVNNPIRVYDKPFNPDGYVWRISRSYVKEPSVNIKEDIVKAEIHDGSTENSWVAQDVMTFPLEGLLDVNGYDEVEFDKEFSDSPWDLALRLRLAGYEVYLTKLLNGYHLEHLHSLPEDRGRNIPGTIFKRKYREWKEGKPYETWAKNPYNLAEDRRNLRESGSG